MNGITENCKNLVIEKLSEWRKSSTPEVIVDIFVRSLEATGMDTDQILRILDAAAANYAVECEEKRVLKYEAMAIRVNNGY